MLSFTMDLTSVYPRLAVIVLGTSKKTPFAKSHCCKLNTTKIFIACIGSRFIAVYMSAFAK
jgi:hypothetical protein